MSLSRWHSSHGQHSSPRWHGLGFHRSGFDQDKIINLLTTHGRSQLYLNSGEGIHRDANKLSEECRHRKQAVTVNGVPKNIDNNVDALDQIFGLEAAVEEAQCAIRSASKEARCLPTGIGVAKLGIGVAKLGIGVAKLGIGVAKLGIGVAKLGIGVAKLEIRRCLAKLIMWLEKRGYDVVVVAESAGEALLRSSVKAEAVGKKKLPLISAFQKDRIQTHFAEKRKDCGDDERDLERVAEGIAQTLADRGRQLLATIR
ncbi:unnamed protein product [Hyaloperonospora brassicae]|uniref:Phosphofructokinase domain-containing protein n=1 Tax=Hyaloperonospora brassicae TaxID=162125 RepID=A0AAV0TMU3_HYABA|nr:unnamed protein product [Hyaloperonospora brassicae]